MDPICGEESLLLYAGSFTDAHNEFLQLLLTLGLAGVISFFALIIGMLAVAVKRSRKHPVLFAGAVCLAAYLAQGIVNSQQIAVTPLLFVLLGWMGSEAE